MYKPLIFSYNKAAPFILRNQNVGGYGVFITTTDTNIIIQILDYCDINITIDLIKKIKENGVIVLLNKFYELPEQYRHSVKIHEIIHALRHKNKKSFKNDFIDEFVTSMIVLKKIKLPKIYKFLISLGSAFQYTKKFSWCKDFIFNNFIKNQISKKYNFNILTTQV